MFRVWREALYRLSIRDLLLAALLVPVLTVTAVGSLWVVRSNSERLRQTAVNSAHALLAAHAQDFVRAIVFNTPDEAADTTARFGRYDDVLEVQVRDQAGGLVLSYVSPLVDPRSVKEVVVPESQALFDDEAVSVAAPVEYQGARYGTAYLRMSTTGLAEQLQRLHQAFGSMASALTLTAVLLAVWLRRMFTGPIERLIGTIRQVAATHDYSARAPVLERNEFGVLADGFNDMLARVQAANAALNDDKIRLQVTLAAIADGVIVVDDHAAVTYINPAAESILRVASDDAVGKAVTQIFNPRANATEDVDHPAAVCLQSRRAVQTGTLSLVRPGQPHDVLIECSVVPLNGATAATRGAVLVLRDVTAQHEASVAAQIALREKLGAEAANQAKSAFLARMSHELRTPLNAVIGYSEIVAEEAKEKGLDEAVADLRRIRSSAYHLLNLINDVLDLSKIEAGKMELFVESFDVKDLVGQVADTIQPLARKNANQFSVTCPDDLGLMCSDVTKLRQCLINLLGNACKFTHGGIVSLAVSARGETGKMLEFAIGDTGIGMSEEQLSRIFEPFSQGDASTTRRYGGTGLGLAITRRFCHLLGGDVSVRSVQGEGTWFTLAIPRTLEKSSGPDPAAPIHASDSAESVAVRMSK